MYSFLFLVLPFAQGMHAGIEMNEFSVADLNARLVRMEGQGGKTTTSTGSVAKLEIGGPPPLSPWKKASEFRTGLAEGRLAPLGQLGYEGFTKLSEATRSTASTLYEQAVPQLFAMNNWFDSKTSLVGSMVEGSQARIAAKRWANAVSNPPVLGSGGHFMNSRASQWAPSASVLFLNQVGDASEQESVPSGGGSSASLSPVVGRVEEGALKLGRTRKELLRNEEEEFDYEE